MLDRCVEFTSTYQSNVPMLDQDKYIACKKTFHVPPINSEIPLLIFYRILVI